MAIRRFAIGLSILLATFTACSSETNRDIAESAVVKFHSQLNSKLYDSILVSAAPEFKAGDSGKEYLEKVVDLLGKVKSTNQVTGSVQNMGTEAQINLVYMTEFTEGQASETFVFRVKDKRASLIHYQVDFQDLSDL
jgi:hypothetical protein